MFLEYRWRQRIRRRLLADAEKYARQTGRVEAALILSVLHDTRQEALSHLERDKLKGMPIYQVHQQKGFGDREEDWGAYLERVKEEMRTIREMGAGRVYLFCKIPVALAVLVGATLSNGPEVILHHYQGGIYFPVGRLTVETVRL